jgi:methylglutaconyl-CoA hydratase
MDELLASADHTPEENERGAARLGAVYTAIRRLPRPVVAVVQGRALAGGAGLATACDLVVAGSSSQFGYPEIQRGFVPAMVMTMLRRVAGEKRAFELVATGRTVTAAEALDLGLISLVEPDTGLETTAKALRQPLAAVPSPWPDQAAVLRAEVARSRKALRWVRG